MEKVVTVPVSGSSTSCVGGHAVDRAGSPRRYVHLPARGAALPDQPAFGQAAQVGALPGRSGVLIAQPHRRDRHRHRSGRSDVLRRRLELRRLGAEPSSAAPHRPARSTRCPGCCPPARRPTAAAPASRSASRRRTRRPPRAASRYPRRPAGSAPSRTGGRAAARAAAGPATSRSARSRPARPRTSSPRRPVRHRVVLERRRVHGAVRAARPEDAPVPERGHELAEHRPERPRVVERDLHRRP